MADCATDEHGVHLTPLNRGEVVNVLRLVEYRCRESISILKALLALALQGKLRGIVVCYRTDDGREKTVHTGIYKHGERAAEATLRASVMMLRAGGEID